MLRDKDENGSRMVLVTTIINGMFSSIAIIFGIIDSFTMLRDLLGVVPFGSFVINIHSSMRIIFSHWWERLSFFGQIVLLVGVSWLGGTILIWQKRKIGTVVVMVSFAIAFVINLFVGLHPWLHLLAGIIAGIIIVPPVLLSWKELK